MPAGEPTDLVAGRDQIAYYGRRWPPLTGHRNPNDILQALCTANADGTTPAASLHGVQRQVPRPAQPDRLAAVESAARAAGRRHPPVRAREQAAEDRPDQRLLLRHERSRNSHRRRRRHALVPELLGAGDDPQRPVGSPRRQGRREEALQRRSESLARRIEGRLRAQRVQRLREDVRHLDGEGGRQQPPAARESRPASVVVAEGREGRLRRLRREVRRAAPDLGRGRQEPGSRPPQRRERVRLVARRPLHRLRDGQGNARQAGGRRRRDGEGAQPPPAQLRADRRLVAGLERAGRQQRPEERRSAGRPGACRSTARSRP